MAELDDRYVKIGLWTNWANGPVLGRTITTDIRTGTIIVSLLALLASLATTHLWHVLTFTAHQLRAKGSPADGLYWQQQALLRCESTPTSLVTHNVNLWWAWRHRSKKSLLRCSAYIVLPVLFSVGTLVATMFTGYVVSTSDVEVLIHSSKCGRIRPKLAGDTYDDNSYNSEVADLASTYTDHCYSPDASMPSSCRNTFVKPRLPISYYASPCPFDQSMCLEGELPALSVDTGLIDLNADLGLNLASADSVKFRKKTTCAVVPLEGHYKIVNSTKLLDPSADYVAVKTSSIVPGEQLLLLFFSDPTSAQGVEEFDNATFVVPIVDYGDLATLAISSLASLPEVTLWRPLPEMTRDDADVALIFVIGNSISYLSPVDDPLFAAHRPSISDNQTIYLPDYPAGALGCTEQYQFCLAQRSGKDLCTPFLGIPANVTSAAFPTASPIQIAALDLLVALQQRFTIAWSPTLGLNVSDYIMPIPSLPADQWIFETTNWVSSILASLQIMFTDYAIGPEIRDPGSKEFVRLAETQEEKALCGAQRMRKGGGYANINFFGLVFILVLSCTIILVDLSLFRVLVAASRWSPKMARRLERWVQDGILQLQRRAFEAEGKGAWEGLCDDVPVTRSEQQLSELALVTVVREAVAGKWNRMEDDLAVLSAEDMVVLDTYRAVVGMKGLGFPR